jgi:glyoxylase-like metal-dependent hydrolase (beta-lactamase superfamily II)
MIGAGRGLVYRIAFDFGKSHGGQSCKALALLYLVWRFGVTQDLQWTVGKVTVTRLLETELVIPYNPVTPFLADATPEALAAIPDMSPHFVTPEGALRLSIHALLIDAPGLRLVVDTCVGNDRARAFINDEPLQTRFLENMEALGWAAETVDAVVCTHLHVDHVGWNTRLVDGAFVPTFPKARYCFARDEYVQFMAEVEAASGPTAEKATIHDDAVRPVVDAGLVHLVACDHQFTSEIRLLPTPGHTAGHVSVLIESEGQRAIISGDAVHHPCQLNQPAWMTPWEHDPAQALETRVALFDDLADSPTRLIGTHFAAPTSGFVVRDADGFRFVPDFSV